MLGYFDEFVTQGYTKWQLWLAKIILSRRAVQAWAINETDIAGHSVGKVIFFKCFYMPKYVSYLPFLSI